MYDFLGIVQMLANLAVATLVALLLYDRVRGGPTSRAGRSRGSRLKRAAVLEPKPDDRLPAQEAARRNLQFLGLPSVEAGQTVTNVPTFDPANEGGWERTREVVTAARAVAYTQQGVEPVELVELSGGYLLAACAGKCLLLRRYTLSAPEETELQRQRQEAVDSNDPVIPSFAGYAWHIRCAFGKNISRKPGERACSYIQVLSRHPRLGQADGPLSILPGNILDGQTHDYYDVRARNDAGTVLYGFYVGGSWACYLGRVLEDTEAAAMQAV
ncbi:MAG: hypothetical protein ACO1SX_00995 [Actinomycetota bacterium]